MRAPRLRGHAACMAYSRRLRWIRMARHSPKACVAVVDDLAASAGTPSRTQGSRCCSMRSIACIIRWTSSGTGASMTGRPTCSTSPSGAKLGHQRAVGLRHQVDARLRRESTFIGAVTPAWCSAALTACVPGRHAGPEPELEVGQRVEARAQALQLGDLVQMGGDVHDFGFATTAQL